MKKVELSQDLSFRLGWSRTVDNRQFLKQRFNFSNHEFEDALRVVEPFSQQLIVKHKEYTWKVVKSHHQIEKFLNYFEQKFGRDPSMSTLSAFLNDGLKTLMARYGAELPQWKPFLTFFEVSDIEFNKVKSMKMEKKSGGRNTDYCCTNFFLGWKEKHFIINYNGIMYKGDDLGSGKKNIIKRGLGFQGVAGRQQQQQGAMGIKEFIPFDKNFKLEYGKGATGSRKGINISGGQRVLQIEGKHTSDYYRFLYFVQYAFKDSNLADQEAHRFESFAPVRQKNEIQFFVDGEGYFKELAFAIQKAESEIYMTGWWISPQFALIRPYSKNLHYRLDNLLLSKAKQGVRIYILVYLESSLIFNDSLYTEQTLQVHPNIKVIRHPLKILPMLWTHHQKLVVIDQEIAFMGGLDITYGRYDNQKHDLHVLDQETFPGIDYSNMRVKDIKDIRNWQKETVPRNEIPRMPWHDVAFKIVGDTVNDLSKHFIEYWNFANFQAKYEQGYMLTLEKNPQDVEFVDHTRTRAKNFGLDLLGAILNNTATKQQQQYLRQAEVINKQPQPSDKATASAVSVPPTPAEQRRVNSRYSGIYNFYNKNNQHPQYSSIEERQSEKVAAMNRLMKVFEEQKLKMPQGGKLGSLNMKQKKELAKRQALKLPLKQLNQQCQALRSASSWSIGLRKGQHQASIHNAYIWLIQNSKSFIYIENQFFISAIQGLTTKNQISNALYARLKRAIHSKKPFKIIVVMPLIPGNPGQLYQSQGQIPRIIMHWQYQTISRHSHSIYQKLEKITDRPMDYIQFYGLRAHGVIEGKPVTEQIYVHTKLMIVDDKYVICGSANLNDRSLNGTRDSELALIMTGGKQVRARINNQNVEVSQKVQALRLSLFNEHFALTKTEAQDPLNPKTDQLIRERAKTNTLIYRQLFGCYPDDTIGTIGQMQPKLIKDVDRHKYSKLAPKIIGHAVQMPLKFLQNQNLIRGAANLYPDEIVT